MGYTLKVFGEVPEWPKGTDCKSVGIAFGGSNPLLPILKKKVARSRCWKLLLYKSIFSKGLAACGLPFWPLQSGQNGNPFTSRSSSYVSYLNVSHAANDRAE